MVLPLPEESPTVPLWPTAGRALGLGKSATYNAAARNEVPGLMKIGHKYVVATATLRAALGLDVEAAAAS